MSGHIVTQGIWERNQPYTADKVLVRNLSVTANAGVDVWGRQKEQPALISVTLSLSERFKSAAEGDVVDRSTVHYGKMSKNIIAAVQERAKAGWLSTHQLALLVEEAACKTAAEPSLISACEVTIYYPKASMLGEGAGMIHSRNSSNGEVSRVLYLRNVRIPCLIGVNSHERKMKQAVIANLWIDCLGEGSPGDGYTTAERILTEVRYCPLHRCGPYGLMNSNYSRPLSSPRLRQSNPWWNHWRLD